MNENDNKCVVLIPAYQPDEKLIKYVDDLIINNFKKIIIIDDGSNENCIEIFNNLKKRKECKVIAHIENCGKGKAIKTGFEYYKKNTEYNNYYGVITADCDGQHSVEDTLKISELICENYKNKNLILGVRNFNKKDIPFRSKFGNNLTSVILKILYGTKIQDTQTGLRGFTNEIIEECLKIQGDRYEYETNMLIYCINNKIPIIQTEIQTIYIEENKSSHFNPIKDSIKIYKLIFNNFIKFSISGIFSFIVDYILFVFLSNIIFKNLKLGNLIFLSTIIARIISSIINFLFNKNLVFNNHEKKNVNMVIKYYCLCIIQMLISAFGVYIICYLIPISKNIVKIIVDSLLFFVSYKVQKEIIFKSKGEI